MKSLDYFGVETGKGKYHEEVFYSIAVVYSALENEIADYLRDYGLSPAKFNALVVIKHRGQDSGISQIEIGNRLIVTASNMTRLLDKLQKEGLIERLAQEGDRRVNLIKITKKGSELLDKAWPGYGKKIEELTGYLNKREQKQIAGLIIKWVEGIKNGN